MNYDDSFPKLPPGVKPEDVSPDPWEPTEEELGRERADRKEP